MTLDNPCMLISGSVGQPNTFASLSYTACKAQLVSRQCDNGVNGVTKGETLSSSTA